MRFGEERPAGGNRVSSGTLVLIGTTATAFVLLALAVSVDGPLSSFDARVSGLAYDTAMAHPVWRTTMTVITTTGSMWILGPLVTGGCLLLLLVGRRRAAVFAAAAMIVTVTTRLVVLHVVARPRPVDQLAPASSYSFPSGHSAASAAAALILVNVCWALLRRQRSRVTLAVVAGLWAVAVGVSRVALVVHWPTDVLGAWLFVLVTVPGVGLLLRRVMRARSPVPDGIDGRARA